MKSIAGRFQMLSRVLAIMVTPVCIAQVPAFDIDRISNWPAPLYWQSATTHSPAEEHHGRIREEASVKQAAATTLGQPAVFVAMTPCRVVDTRAGSLPFGGPAFAASDQRTIPMPASTSCTIPATAVAYSLNIAVVPLGTQMRWLTAWDTGDTQPNTATLNDKAGLVTSNAAVVPAGTNGSIDVFVTDETHVIIDINGYYAPPVTLPLTGSAAAPALTLGDTTSGLYSDASGTVSIATGGINRLTVDSAGDLDLSGNIRKGDLLFIHNLGFANTALGENAMSNSTGILSTAVGYHVLASDTTGVGNTATGSDALFNNTTGSNNTGMGNDALGSMTTGSNNTAVGSLAGLYPKTGSYNIFIANQGTASDTNLIRIGDANQTKTYISGIRGVTTDNADALAVVIDSKGQLGTVSSSRRVKREIEDMGDTTATILALRPVTFRYQAHSPDSPLQYGLIAEQVAGIAPDLVARGKDGEIETVYYDKVNAMLLNEVQKLLRENQEQRAINQTLESRLAELESRIK